MKQIYDLIEIPPSFDVAIVNRTDYNEINLGITYFIIESFPKYIKIDAKGNISSKDSNVSVWDMNNNKKYDKNNRKR